MNLETGDQNLTDEQIAESQETLNLFDTNGDGTIATEELQNVYDENSTDSDLQNIIDRLDVDGSGTIDASEFRKQTAVKTKDIYSDDAFKKLDSNSDEFISVPEFREKIANLGLNDDEVDEMIREVDIDSDRQINYDEFAAGGRM